MIDGYVSDIPKGVTEKTVSEYREKRGAIWLKRTECWFEGKIVGERSYDKEGTMVIERPLKNGKIHGVEYYWDDDGTLSCAEPYENGLPHGTANQWNGDQIIGTYTLIHGTGYDLWRRISENGDVILSEIHSMKNGCPHGYEWWLNEDQESVYSEKHYVEGKLHGIERQWEYEGGLSEGYPKYWVNNNEVAKSKYLEESNKDDQLPAFLEEEQVPKRSFPAEIHKIMGKC